MPTIKVEHRSHPTDYIAIAFAVLLSPLLIMRSSSSELVYMASDIGLYSDKYFNKVRAPISTAILQYYIYGSYYEIPHVLIPGYSKSQQYSFVDAVAFIGLYYEMIYSYRFAGIRYRSPYVSHRPLFTSFTKSSLSDEESMWKDVAYYFSGYTNCSGAIQTLKYDPASGMVAGITDRHELFVLDSYLRLVLKSDAFQAFVLAEGAARGIARFYGTKLLVEHELITTLLFGTAVSGETIILVYRCDMAGNTVFQTVLAAKPYSWGDNVEAMVVPVQLGAGPAPKNPYAVLRNVVAHPSRRSHGETVALYEVAGDEVGYIVIQTPYLVVALHAQTGAEVASFLVRPGMLLSAEAGEATVYYLSDQQMIEGAKGGERRYQRFDLVGRVLNDAAAPRFVTPVSEEGTVVEQQMRPDTVRLRPTTMVLAYPCSHPIHHGQRAAIFLTPSGLLVSTDAAKGTKRWAVPIPGFIPTTNNAHLTVYRTEAVDLVLLSLDHHLWIYNANDGQLMASWEIDPELQVYDTTQVGYDDNAARVYFQVLVEKLHPYIDKKAVMVIYGTYMDVLGVGSAGIALVDFWERTMLVGMVAFVMAMVLRMAANVTQKKE